MTRTFARNWRSLALRGISALAFGGVALFWPSMPLPALALLIGAYALVDGILTIALGTTKHASRHVAWGLALGGIAGVALGVVVLSRHGMGAQALTLLVALWAIASGLLQVLTAVHLRRELPGESLLGVEGGVSIVLGVAILLWPTAGATSLVILFGSYALVFGTAMLAQAHRLRARMQQLKDEDEPPKWGRSAAALSRGQRSPRTR